MEIKLVKNEEIDKVKWNSCVHYANNGNVFGYKWFLDHVAKDWDGLVEGDYESVFPLVWRKGLLGSKELHQPPLMRELGLYSIHALSAKRVEHFLNAIPNEYKRIEIVVNEQINLPKNHDFKVEELYNHQMLLTESYEILHQHYTDAIKEKLTIAAENKLVPNSNLKPEVIADFYRKHAKDRQYLERNFHALQRIMYNVLHRGWGFASGMQDENGELLAVNFFIYSHNKVLSLIPVESPRGAAFGALAYLFDLLLRTHAGRPMILDFNTTKTDELALGLGARENLYYKIGRDRRKWVIF